MRNEFHSFYYPTDDDFKKTWQEGMFVLDTNVLLNLYRYPQDTSSELLRVFSRIQNQLWVPHQVILEYHRNRLAVISEQVEKYDQVKTTLEKSFNELEGRLSQLQVGKRHAHIDPEQLLTNIRKSFEEFTTELDELKLGQPSIFDDDHIREQVSKLLEGRIGNRPDQSYLDQIYQKGKDRFEAKIPPGFRDKAKDKDDSDFHYRGLLYKREFGDLILWQQIIDEANQQKIKSVVLVTDDTKSDWWSVHESKGQRMTSPHRELIEEICSLTDVQTFHTYTSEQFLKDANKYLDTQVKQELIEEVRNVNKRRVVDDMHHRNNLIEQAVLKWLKQKYADEIVIKDVRSSSSFIVTLQDGHKISYEARYIHEPRHLSFIMRDRIYRYFYEISSDKYDTVGVIIITEDEEKAREACNFHFRVPSEIINNLHIYIGVFDLESENIDNFMIVGEMPLQAKMPL